MNTYFKYVVKKLKLDKRAKNKSKINTSPLATQPFFMYPSKSFDVQTCINKHILEVSPFL